VYTWPQAGSNEKGLIDSRGPPNKRAECMVKIKIDYSKCVREKEKICVELCPVSVFSFEKTSKPKVANAENCILCRTCQVNCPSQAIEIVA